MWGPSVSLITYVDVDQPTRSKARHRYDTQLRWLLSADHTSPLEAKPLGRVSSTGYQYEDYSIREGELRGEPTLTPPCLFSSRSSSTTVGQFLIDHLEQLRVSKSHPELKQGVSTALVGMAWYT